MNVEVTVVLVDPNGRSEDYWKEIFEDIAAEHDAVVAEVEWEG